MTATPMAFYRVDVAFLRREDFLDLSLVQQALLIRLRGYAAEQGTLPADLRSIVRRFGGRPKDVAPLERWFPLQEDGAARWDPELELDRARLADIKGKRSAAGLASAEARRQNAEQGESETVQSRSETVQGRSKTAQGSSKDNGPRTPVEQVLSTEPSAATSYAPTKADAGTGEVEHLFNHAVHSSSVHAVPAVHSVPAVPAEQFIPAPANSDQQPEPAGGGRGPFGAAAALPRRERGPEEARTLREPTEEEIARAAAGKLRFLGLRGAAVDGSGAAE